MKLNDVKQIKKGQRVVANMGYKFSGSKVYAIFTETQLVSNGSTKVELCSIKPYMVIEDKCGFAHFCLNNNMLVEPRQILQVFEGK